MDALKRLLTFISRFRKAEDPPQVAPMPHFTTVTPAPPGPVWITYPRPGMTVSYLCTVRGLTTLGHTRIEIFVRAGDQQWYLQPPVTQSGTRFHGRAALGFPQGAGGGEYTVVALAVPTPSNDSPVLALPEGLQSAPVRVRRAAFDADRPTGYDNPRPTHEEETP